jgi:signal transduction histidine kinase
MRLSRLVSRLLDLARADMARTGPDSVAHLPDVLTRLADAHAAPDFALECRLPADLPALAMDQAALETVLATLIENARQAGAARLSVSAMRQAAAVSIALADDGPGIAPADAGRIFDPFFTSKRESGGTGLGLPIARALAEGCGGTLDLDERASGARFVLRLPVAG